SINHLSSFKDWQAMFRNVAAHLSPGGVFIFDMNTLYAFEAFEKRSPMVEEEQDTLMVTHFKQPRADQLAIDMRMLRKTKGNVYKEFRTTIMERSYPFQQVRKSLQKYFSQVDCRDMELHTKANRPHRYSEVLYFVCR
ncbi:MAG: hypothetical protein KDD55_13160, partial [Bdellovibrionales bacterium]|nr:hypothetical protein [Bdellovibrionales bacterium]